MKKLFVMVMTLVFFDFPLLYFCGSFLIVPLRSKKRMLIRAIGFVLWLFILIGGIIASTYFTYSQHLGGMPDRMEYKAADNIMTYYVIDGGKQTEVTESQYSRIKLYDKFFDSFHPIAMWTCCLFILLFRKELELVVEHRPYKWIINRLWAFVKSRE